MGAGDEFSDRLAEEVVLLYLRLNGYLTLGGYLLHRPLDEGEGLRTEIDALAVRFPHQREPLYGAAFSEQPNDPLLVLPSDAGLVDFVVVEVKTTRKQPRFNKPLVKNDAEAQKNLEDLLSMLGCFVDPGEIPKAATAILEQLRGERNQQPVAYALNSGQARIRFLLFWEPGEDRTTDRHFISLAHVIEFIEGRTRPGLVCGEYSRWAAKWRGLHRHILEALDEARAAGRVPHDLVSLSNGVLRRLGSEAAKCW